MNDKIKSYIKHLNAGKVIAYPTETLWGLGANAYSEQSVDKVYQIKGRPQGMAVSILIHSYEQLEELADLSSQQVEFLKATWPKPLTAVIAVKSSKLAPQIVNGGYIGIRFANHPFLEEILPQLDFPLTTTSANRTGEPAAQKRDDLSWLDDPEVIVIEDFEVTSQNSLGSTVVRFTMEKTQILRQGDLEYRELKELCEEFGLPVPAEA